MINNKINSATPYLFYLLSASLLTSKSALTLFSYLCVLAGIYYFFKNYKNTSPQEKQTVFTFMGFYILAIAANLLSLGGVDIAGKVAATWIWPLFVFVAFYLHRNRKVLEKTLYLASLGLWAACAKAFWNFYFFWQSPLWTGFNANTRIPSFWDVSRWSFFCVVSLIVLTGFIGTRKFSALKKWQKFYFFTLTTATSLSLFITGSRGPWISAVIAIIALITAKTRSIKKIAFLALGLIVIFSVLIISSKDFSERLQSVTNVRIDNGMITSNNISNAGRLHMWKVAFDYLSDHPFQPTGFENTENAYRHFLSEQGEEYSKKYVMSEFSLRDQHSSYVSLMVQFGIIFSVLFFGYVIYAFGASMAQLLKTSDAFFTTCWGLLLSQLILYVFYSSVLSYEALVLVSVVGMIRITERRSNQECGRFNR